ncbi:MAG: HipA domain-containing protein [Parasporobacterium sp.]|nr:HipA domain-containing protein [Parasporobacterium sp.]
MNCLCCGRPLKESASEQTNLWHKSCIRKFFATEELPELDISDEGLNRIVTEAAGRGYTIPGVQKKLSLHLESSGLPRLTVVDYPNGYILKPQSEDYPSLPEAEHLVMRMAEKTGIRVVPFGLLRSEDQKSFSYITRRIDRSITGKKKQSVQKIAMEDFCQLDGKLTADKYHGSYERCAKIVLRYSRNPGLDLSELYLRLVFSFVTGNSDMHLKNFSLFETVSGSRQYGLSPAYDLLPVNLILPEDQEQTALTINGKKRNLHKNDFLKFAHTSGINEKAADNLIAKVIKMQDRYHTLCRDSWLPEDMQTAFIELMDQRIESLK